MLSRRKTRTLLVQLLYADVFVHRQSMDFMKETYGDILHFTDIDKKYLGFIKEKVYQESSFFLGIISKLAPKFKIEELSKIHIIILCIALSEILFWEGDSIDIQISINEAIELGKLFSDLQGTKFINGVLGEFARNKANYEIVTPCTFKFFY